MRYWMGIAFFSCVLTAMAGGAVMAAMKSGPEQSLREAQKAIDSRDMAKLETYLDLQRLVSKAVDVAVTDDSVMRSVEKYPAAALVLAVGSASGANDAIRTMLTREALEYVRHGVTSGAFAGSPVEGASVYRGIFVKAFRGGQKDRVLLSPGKVVNKDASSATMSATLAHGDTGRAYPLELLAEKQGSIWRIVEVINMPDLIHTATRKNK